MHDPGLPRFLLGVESEDVLDQHTLRGALLETLVVNEFLKVRFHQGLPGNVHFWRDNIGTEVDRVIESADTLTPVEIKAGQTFTSDYFTALTRWSSDAGALGGRPHLVYAGDQSNEREGVSVHSWQEV